MFFIIEDENYLMSIVTKIPKLKCFTESLSKFWFCFLGGLILTNNCKIYLDTHFIFVLCVCTVYVCVMFVKSEAFYNYGWSVRKSACTG